MKILVEVDLNDIEESGTYCLKPVAEPTPVFFEPDGEWVSVEERLPTEPQACWIKSEGKVVPVVALYKPQTKSWEVFPPAMTFTVGFVTHWMPITIK